MTVLTIRKKMKNGDRTVRHRLHERGRCSDVGKRLGALRERRREAADNKDKPLWTAEGIAKRIGVSRGTYSMWEGGKAVPSLGEVEFLAEQIFKVPVEYLAYGVETLALNLVSIPVMESKDNGKMRRREGSLAAFSEDLVARMRPSAPDNLKLYDLGTGIALVDEGKTEIGLTAHDVLILVHGSPTKALASLVPGGSSPKAKVRIGKDEHQLLLRDLDVRGRVVTDLLAG